MLAHKLGFWLHADASHEGRPPLTYIDAQGVIHAEDYRSAEELIAAFQQKKGAPSK